MKIEKQGFLNPDHEGERGVAWALVSYTVEERQSAKSDAEFSKMLVDFAVESTGPIKRTFQSALHFAGDVSVSGGGGSRLAQLQQVQGRIK